MIKAPIPESELERIESLRKLEILDTASEAMFDGITELAARICNVPIALVSLVDSNRQWFKSRVGLEATETPREISFCGHAILNADPLVVNDAKEDPRFSDNPLVIGEPNIRFYAGVPLITKEGYGVGTLCVIDQKPGSLSDCQKFSLQTLANQVVSLMELRLANQRLEEGKARLATLTGSMVEGMVYQDSTGNIIEFNKSACKVLGLTPDQLQGRTSFDPRWRAVKENGEDFPGSEHPAMISLSTGKPLRHVIMGVHHPDATIRWISINSSPVFNNGNEKPTHVVSTFSDVTESKNLLKAVQESEEKFRSIFNHAQIGMLEIGPDQTILESNSFFAEMLGYTPSEMKGMRIIDITHPNDVELTQYRLNEMKKPGTTFKRFKKKYKSKTGQLVWGQVSSKSFVIDKTGEVHLFSAVEDITDLIRMEENLKEQEAKLLQSSKMSSLGEMAAGMAHEINNPLAIIGASASLIRKQIENKSAESIDLGGVMEKLGKIENTVDRISKIVRGLRSFARNSDQDPKISTPISLIVDDTLSLCREKFKYSSIELIIDSAEDPILLCRPSQISQVLLNLLNNSYDAVHGMESSWIRIETHSENGTAILTVTDSGNGIPLEIQQKLMQPFFTTKEIGKGTGLGLSISQGIISEHGGKFYYDSKSANTRFVIELPVYEQ
jgi:PAS domain S-box-containing protein